LLLHRRAIQLERLSFQFAHQGEVQGDGLSNSAFTPVIEPPRTRLVNGTVPAQVAVFAIGATSGIHLSNFTVTGLSFVCLLLVPAFLLMTHRGVDLVPLVLAVLGWISYLASGLVHGVSPLWPNAVAPAAFSLYFIGLTVVTGRSVDLIAMILGGLGIGSLVFFFTTGIALSNTGNFLDFWKYGIAPGVTTLVLFGLAMARAPLVLHALALGLLGVASLGLNFRSHALVCLLASAILFSHRFLRRRVRRGWRFAGIIAFGLVFGYAMPFAARAGLFGPALQSKEIEQATTGLPTLLAGRTEPPETITAIIQHPLLGWGSALKFTPDFYTQAEHVAVRMGYMPTFPFELYWRLPAQDESATHSLLLGSWAEGGVLAVLLPVFLLVACLGVVWNYARFGKWAALVVTVGLQGVWDLLFQPWAYNMLPVFACVALLYGAVHFRPEPAPLR
jgi:hypothetical protein